MQIRKTDPLPVLHPGWSRYRHKAPGYVDLNAALGLLSVVYFVYVSLVCVVFPAQVDSGHSFEHVFDHPGLCQLLPPMFAAKSGILEFHLPSLRRDLRVFESVQTCQYVRIYLLNTVSLAQNLTFRWYSAMFVESSSSLVCISFFRRFAISSSALRLRIWRL